MAVILSRPLCLLWQNIYLEHGQNNTIILLVVAVFLDLFSLFICVILGSNRSKMFVAAAFLYSIISTAQIPAVYFIAVILYPLVDTPTLSDAAAQFPQLYYSGLFLNNLIITACCFYAGHLLRKTQVKPTLKINLLFSLFFILFSLMVLLWFSDIVNIMSISFLKSGLLGMMLLGILLFVFYMYIQLNINSVTEKTDHSQYIQQLSKRELEVIEAVVAGNDSYKKLAAALNISVNTVKTHLKHIYQTTEISSIAAISRLFRGYTSNHP